MRQGILSWTVPGWARQAVNFGLIYISYMAFYFDRKNYAFWLNELIRTVGKSKEEVSVFGSVMEMAYGAGKLVAGPIADTASPSIVLCVTLGIASICNLLMFQTEWMTINISLWAVNGLVQSAAWPALALIFMNWFKNSPDRGIWYSILSTNQNLGSALTPVILTPLVQMYGWKSATIAPGLIGLGFAVIMLLFLQENPDVDFEKKKQETTTTTTKTAKKSTSASPPPSWSQTLQEMITSVNLLSLGLGYAFLSVIRVGIQDWSLIILQDTRGLTMEQARDCMVLLELGGFIGGVSAGAVSDRAFGGRRGPAMVLFTGAIAPIIAGIMYLPIPKEFLAITLSALYFCFGFASFGPHMLVGLTAREVFPKAPATAGSFTKSLAQVGGTLAGYPLSVIVSMYGWYHVGVVWTVCAIVGALSFAPLLAVPAYQEEEEEEEEAHTKKKTN